MKEDTLIFRVGRKFLGYDILLELSQALKISKSELKRLIKQGGAEVILPKGWKIKEQCEH